MARKVVTNIFKQCTLCSFRIMVMVSFSKMLVNHLQDYCVTLRKVTVWKLNGADSLLSGDIPVIHDCDERGKLCALNASV
jgi:hypothetical protein